MKKLGQKLPPLKKMRLSKKSKKEDDEKKRRLTETNQYWNDRKFQIQSNKLVWLNQRSCNEQKNNFLSSKIKLF